MRRLLIAAGWVLLVAFALAPALRQTNADRDLAASAHTPARAPERATPDAAPTKDPAQRSEASAPEVIPVPDDPRAAQQMVLRRRDIEDCLRARSAWWAERWTDRTGVRWLPPKERQRVEQAFAQSRARQLDSCRRQGLRLEGTRFRSCPMTTSTPCCSPPPPPAIPARACINSSGSAVAAISTARCGRCCTRRSTPRCTMRIPNCWQTSAM
jgi:hypothetical protein